MKNFLDIRNVLIKTIAMMIGVICMIASVYNGVMWAFLLTDKEPENEVYWWLLIVGFFLALGAAFYNRIVDAISNGFSKLVDRMSNK
ncbi:hypothetical protein I215_01928 [Galbibacter marinus]|uniref:Uncharacterized protein n=1 Tax=Galbibacter marinus TaxID=555500 RepID=K2QN35_9FLAO|nr:hypothetical protein [Galbibacter marinus]EKF56242.1 hypothetical protein I215_01928 [Galbibacter marinus]